MWFSQTLRYGRIIAAAPDEVHRSGGIFRKGQTPPGQQTATRGAAMKDCHRLSLIQ
jgi:hypothetical protein